MTTLLDLHDEVVATDGDREAFVQPLADGRVRRITFAQWAAHADGVSQKRQRSRTSTTGVDPFRHSRRCPTTRWAIRRLGE